MIDKIQLRKLSNRVLEKYLKSGIFPEASTVIASIQDFFKTKLPGFPTMVLGRIGFREKTDPEIVNLTFQEIRDDLETLYEESIDQTRRLLVNFNWAQGERIKIDQEIKDIEGTLRKLIFLSNNGEGYFSAIHDTFSDLSKTNLDAFRVIENRNLIPAEIDLKGQFVRLRERAGKVHKYDISKSFIQTTMSSSKDILKDTEVGLSNPLDDDMNTSWVRKVVTKGISDVVVSMNIDIKTQDGKNTVTSTSFSLTFNSPKATSVQVILTNQDGRRMTLEERKFTGISVWYFVPFDVSKITLIMKKTEPDEEIQNNNDTSSDIPGKYMFLCSNMALLITEFEEKGEFISIAHDIEKLTKDPVGVVNVRLDVSDEKPPNTEIKYWISTNGSLWKRIYDFKDTRKEAAKIVRMGFAYEQEKEIQRESYEENSDFAIPLFKLADLFIETVDITTDTEFIPSSVRVFTGVNQQNVDLYEYTWRLNDPLHIAQPRDHINVPELVRPDNIEHYYKDINIGNGDRLVFVLPEDNRSLNFKFSTNVYVEDLQGLILKPKEMNLDKAPDIFSASVYINGKQIWNIVKGNQTTLPDFVKLKNGWNRIEFFAYTDTVTTNNQTVEFVLFDSVFKDLKFLANVDSLTQVPFFELAFNRRSQDKSIYGFDGRQIFVNYNPNTLSVNYDQTRFLICYSFFKNNEISKVLYFRAQLSRDSDIGTEFNTPLLRDYRLSLTHFPIQTDKAEQIDIDPEQEQEADEFIIFHTTREDWEGV